MPPPRLGGALRAGLDEPELLVGTERVAGRAGADRVVGARDGAERVAGREGADRVVGARDGAERVAG
ncbi:MAG: hypothetical protein P8L30_00955, partial [Longimicrobiales bacterium]|nr:hypothetical protein [Longimicrobiales bacterium]